MKKTFLLLLAYFITQIAFSQAYQNNWASMNSGPTPAWFGNIKFGIFIHWGVYAIPASAAANEDI